MSVCVGGVLWTKNCDLWSFMLFIPWVLFLTMGPAQGDGMGDSGGEATDLKLWAG